MAARKGNLVKFRENTSNLISPAEYHKSLFVEAINRIAAALESGELNEDEATQLELNAIAELNERLEGENIDHYATELGYDPEEVADYLYGGGNGSGDEEFDPEEEYEDGTEEYTGNMKLAQFSASSAFAYNLQALLESDGIDELEEAVPLLCQGLGVNSEEATGLLTGDYVPSEEIVDMLSRIYQLDAENHDALVSSAVEAWQESGLLQDETDPEDDETENYRMSQMQQQIAEFSTKEKLRDGLARIEALARQGMAEWWLPPSAYKAIIGDFELEADRIAAFSAVCDDDGVDLGTRLYSMEFAIACFKEAGPVYGDQVVEAQISPEEARFEASVEDQAQRNFKLRKSRAAISERKTNSVVNGL